MAENFSAAYAVSKKKADVILGSPELKVHGISVYHEMREYLGVFFHAYSSSRVLLLSNIVHSSKPNGVSGFDEFNAGRETIEHHSGPARKWLCAVW